MNTAKLLLAASPGILALAGLVFHVSTREGAVQSAAPVSGTSIEQAETLSPKDLGMDKQRFKARPGAGEVAIFRSSTHSRLEPPKHQTYDQIFWTGGDEAVVDVVIAPMSFYRGYPEQGSETKPEGAHHASSTAMASVSVSHTSSISTVPSRHRTVRTRT